MMNRMLMIAVASMSVAVSILITGCVGSQSASTLPLREELLTFDGSFSWDKERRDWKFSNLEKLANVISGYEVNNAIDSLISCISDVRPSKVLLESGHPVALGIVCQTALSVTASYEKANDDGDIAEFPPQIDPKASGSDLEKIQKAWKDARALNVVIIY